MLKDTYKLGKRDTYNLVVYYDPTKANWLTRIQIGISKNNVEQTTYLTENTAAILYVALIQGQINDNLINKNCLPENWPDIYDVGYTFYRTIKTFLQDYRLHFITVKGHHGGFRFDMKHVRCIIGEKIHEADTKEIENVSLDLPTYRHYEISKLLLEVARELCKTARDSGRLIAPDKLPPTEKVKLPELHAEAELTRNDKIKTLRQLIDELSDKKNTSLRGIFITGSGGSGKTFSLLDYTATSLDDTTDHSSGQQPIPIYIALNQMNTQDNSYRSIESFIIDRLVGLTTDSNSRKIIEEQYYKWLNSTDSQYYPLLLLDGFNEVTDSNIQSHIENDVNSLKNRTNSPYKFIITSRYDLSSAFSKVSGSSCVSQFEAYTVSDLKDKDIKSHVRKYLKSMSWTDEEIDRVIEAELMEPDLHTNKLRVKDFLKKPMAIVLFCYMHEPTGNSSEAIKMPMNTLGELIAAFISKVKLGTASSDEIKNRDECFLEYLGYRMNCDGVFSIDTDDFQKYWDDFKNIFHEEFDLTGVNLAKLCRSPFIDDILKFVNDANRRVVRNNTEELFTTISFMHQNYRDYFAAEFLKKIIISKNVSKINKYLGEQPVPLEVLVILSELLAEYSCVDNTNASHIQQFFRKYCEKRSLKPDRTPILSPMVISELIKVVSLGRKTDLSSFDFSNLDLSSTNLNGIKLSRGENNGFEHIAKFGGAKLAQETLDASGPAGAVQMMLYVDPCLLTFSKRGFFAFDMKNRVQYPVADYYEDAVDAAVLLKNKNEIVTGDRCGRLIRWHYSKNESGSLSLSKISELIIGKDISCNKRNKNIQCIVNWNDKLIICTKCGDVYVCEIDLSEICLFTSFDEIIDASKSYCMATVCHNSLYISYGMKIRQFIDSSTPKEEKELSQTENNFIRDIGSIGIKNANRTEYLFINIRGMISDQNLDSSGVFWCVDFQEIKPLLIQEHSTTKQGFKGWNRFSASNENSEYVYKYAIYLSANIEDTQNEAGFWEISLTYQDNLYPRIIPQYGNQHRMSVEYVLPFEYAMQHYVATGSIDRSTEIIKTDGGEAAFIRHLSGHTDGIHYLDIVSDNKFFTAHYSGEVCVWEYIDRTRQWKCRHAIQAHRHWVWETKHIDHEGDTFILSCSYDHRISVINEATEKTWHITEPKGRILSFEVFGNFVIAAYDYNNLQNEKRQSNAVLQVFKIDDYAKGYYSAGNECILKHQIRFMRRIDDFILMCSTDCYPGEIYKIYCKDITLKIKQPKVFHQINLPQIKKDNKKIHLRAVDALCLDDKTYLYAAAGDSDNIHIVEIWSEALSIPVFPNFDKGISSICLHKQDKAIYLFVASCDGTIATYELQPTSDAIQVNLCGICRHSDQILHIQAHNQTLYASLLSGKVFAWELSKITHKHDDTFSENDAQLLFHTISGLNICNVDFSNSNTIDWDDDFRAIIKYYEYSK